MPSLPRRRRIKRPTILAKRSQLAKNDLFKKRSYKPLYEQLKANNNALAKALSNEKQETKYLYTQNIELNSQIQELGVACTRRDNIISGVLKNAKESLQLMITLSSYITDTIASCQQVVTTTRYTPRKSTSNNRSRDSTRRLSGKSPPARGVVQPMISGHTITKPTINLSRLNIQQREYRVQNPPNLSDIEEVVTPTQSPAAAAAVTTTEPTNSLRIPISTSLNYGTRRVLRLPERFQGSIGSSVDENERRSSVRSNRNSNRYSAARRSRRSPESLSDDPTTPARTSTLELRLSERLKSPRVALRDVSPLLQNSQSVNIRTLLENSTDMDMTPSPAQIAFLSPSEMPNSIVFSPPPQQIIAESSEESESDANVMVVATPEPSKSKIAGKKRKNLSLSDVEDPLEGPSWLLDVSENPSFSTQDQVSTTTTTTTANSTRHQNTKDDAKNEDSDDEKRPGARRREEYTGKRTTRSPKPYINLYNNLNNEDDEMATTNLARFVTRERGSVCDDEDDYTLLWKRPETHNNYDFDLNDFVLPVLESPIVVATTVDARKSEPELTTNIQMINRTFDNNNLPSTFPRFNAEQTSTFDHTGLELPRITERLETPPRGRSAVVEQELEQGSANEEEEEEGEEEAVPQNPQRQYKNKPVVDLASDPEWTATTPKRNNTNLKRKNSKTKDPSSAKVVLQKLNETHVKKRSRSPETRFSSAASEPQRRNSSMSLQREGSSDSEGSNAGTTAKNVPTRPRRQKAPTNLQEPSLGKKMRRN